MKTMAVTSMRSVFDDAAHSSGRPHGQRLSLGHVFEADVAYGVPTGRKDSDATATEMAL